MRDRATEDWPAEICVRAKLVCRVPQKGRRAALLQEQGDFFCDLGGLSGGFGEAGGGVLSRAAGNARAGVADLTHVRGEQSEAALVDEATDGGSVIGEKRLG